MHHLCPPFFVQFLPGTPLGVVQCQHNQGILQGVRTCPNYSTNLFARLPLAILFCWIYGPCCVLLAVAFHGLPTHRFKNCKFRALSPSRRLAQRVFIAPVAVNNKNSSVRSSLPTKTPRIHLMFNVAPSSEWFRPKHTSPNGTTSPVQDDKEVSRLPSLGNCFQPIHKVVPSSPSKHDQVQLLSCTPLRRLLEMPQVVPESSNSIVLHAPSSLPSLLALQSQSELWIDTV